MDPVLSRRLDPLLAELRVVIVPVAQTQAGLARSACRDYGRESGHHAGLNYGDCFSYALAADRREPLVYKGEDSRHTDLELAVR